MVMLQNEFEFISLHKVKWFKVFLSNANNSIQYLLIAFSQFNDLNYCNLSAIDSQPPPSSSFKIK